MRGFKNKTIALTITSFLAAATLLFFILKQNAEWFSHQDYYVIDGDTIYMENMGKIRYIGIDCPEYDEPYYEEAYDYNEKLLEKGDIRLEYDTEAYDKYGRVLAYVFVDTDDGNRLFVNEELARAGWATTKYVKPYFKYADLLYDAESDAQKRNLGIWANGKQ